MEDIIKAQFAQHKIAQLQLDPYGVCNASCWFCPVRYQGNPSSGKETMSPELLEKIISNLIEEREKPDGLVHKNFGGLYTAHYNEILLYKHFEEMLKILRRYKLVTIVLTNGTPLTPEKTELIYAYRDVVRGICINAPVWTDKETFALRTGMLERNFDTLRANVAYAYTRLKDMVANKSFSIQINGITERSMLGKGGWIEKGPDFPTDIDLSPDEGEIVQQARAARELFPGLQVFEMPSLIDRAGLLGEVMTNKGAIEEYLQPKGGGARRVVGCGNGREVGGRPVGWLHVNAAGKAFLCCNDYDFFFKFGDFKTQQLSDFWGGDIHREKVRQSYETICTNCASAIWQEA